MPRTKIKLIDDSGDRKYFTIVPNYILNHSTAIDQALYLQMKRYAGENGKCFATQETLMKQMGIGRQALAKSLKYLVEHKWIDLVGTTKGKTRPIKTYKINDIWQENADCYKKIPSETAVSFKGDTVQNSSKIPSETAVEEEPVEEEPNNNPSNGQAVAEVINLFKDVNPAYKGWFSNKTQRKSAAALLEAQGMEKIKKAVQLLATTNTMPYIPTITTPYMLESKWAAWESAIRKELSKKQTNREVII